MTEDAKVLLSLIIGVILVVLSLITWGMATDVMITYMTVKGANPVAARCALKSSEDRVCAIYLAKEQK